MSPKEELRCGARRSPLLWKTPPPTAKPTHTPQGSRQGRHRGGDITGTGVPPHPTRPPHLYRPPQPATKERTGGGGAAATSPLPAAESRGAINQNQFQPIQEEEDMELEDELLGPEVPEEEVPQVEPEQKPKPFPQAEPKAKQEDPKPQEYREESPQPYGDGLTKPGIRQLSMRSNSSYVSSVDEDYRSIHVQTSRHLFWVDRLIQVSEHSLQPVISTQPVQKSTKETTRGPAQQTVPKDPESSKKQSQDPSAQQGPRDKASQKTPSPEPSFCVPSMGLEELINFASTLAMASSSRMDLPSLQHMIKTTPQKTMPPPTEPAMDHAAQPTTDKPEQENLTKDEKPPEEPREVREPQDAPKQGDKDVPHPYLDLGKPGFKRATIEGELKFLQSPPMSPQPKGAAKEPAQKPQRLLTQDPGEEQTGRAQKGRLPQRATLLTQKEPAAALATGAEQASQRTRQLKGLEATHTVQSGPQTRSQRGSFADKNLLPLTARQLAAFQDVFKLFSSSPTGSVDMRSMKTALCNVGVQLSPQEMCEALRQADLDGDGTVSFKDFLGVLTDSHRLAQCLGKVRNSWACDPQGLQTLFLEMLFKLMSLGYVPFKSVREVMSYYSKKQRSLRLNASRKGRSRSHGRSGRSHAGLAFFCQAARLIGLSNAELARSLHGLYKAGAPGAGRGPAGLGTLSHSRLSGRTPFSSSSSLPRPRSVQPLLPDT
ncbi:spermatogenesis-associated protein 32 [Cervus canadensis]|uniref:spermatogenesis-associated protein 32 n=1 Tax=Cervus canadensis TaxID=1574408 RepID=UPI001C9E46D6|nr:spermatogenesis-associated protein 32 [Cervus canadensis]